jgi:hypothetical protein
MVRRLAIRACCFRQAQDPAEFAHGSRLHRGIGNALTHRFAAHGFCAPVPARKMPKGLRSSERHRRLNFPGTPRLNRFFGAEWTEAYFSQCLYAWRLRNWALIYNYLILLIFY